MPKFDIKPCARCGREFDPRTWNQKYCGLPDCEKPDEERKPKIIDRTRKLQMISCAVCDSPPETLLKDTNRMCPKCGNLRTRISTEVS